LIYRKQFVAIAVLGSECCELTTFRIFDISQTVYPGKLDAWRPL